MIETRTRTRRKRRRRSTDEAFKLRLPKVRDNPPFWLLVLLVILGFGLGGSSRGDDWSLVMLRPAACVIGALGAMTLQRQHIAAYRWLFVLVGCCVGLLALQLVPMPPWLFEHLPGRGVIFEIDRVSGIGPVWRPMTMTPLETLDSLWSMAVPVAGLVLLAQLGEDDLRKLLPLFLAIGAFSIVLGQLQISGDPKGPLYLYAASKGLGGCPGLFANKNHQAIFLSTLLPMLAAFRNMTIRRLRDTEKVRTVEVLSLVAMVAFVPLLLVTNSRIGLTAGAIGLVLSIWAFRQKGMKLLVPALIVPGAILLFVLAQISNRALAWNRLLELDPVAELRFRILPMMQNAIMQFLPWGMGGGGFQRLYALMEPDSFLSPAVMNQVHDDWLDIPLAYGVFGIIMLLAVIVAVVRTALRQLRNQTSRTRPELGRAAAIALALLALGSISDYPLRSSALQLEWLVLMCWLFNAAGARTASDVHEHDYLSTARANPVA